MRAIAVLAVVIYHLWPTSLPGGYVGVDVFFVISGFLITSHLLKAQPETVGDLTAFWARRIRRLLPAAVLVLACTLAALVVLTPDVVWTQNARHVMASVLYFENWQLASDSVNYLQAGAAATTVQHFWSLSVEEQFYLVWPLLIMFVAVMARRLRWRTPVAVGAAIAVVVASSFAYSVWDTAADPSVAYFSTPVRMWELAAGGLLAVCVTSEAVRRGGRVLWSIVGMAGLIMIAVVAWRYSAATPFPGWTAALPVGGAIAVIAAGDAQGRGAAARTLSVPPLPFLGDISYSIYLWHWPLIVLLPYVSGTLGPLDKVTIVVASVLLAVATKRLVEDPFRRPGVTWVGRMPFRFALVAMIIITGAGVGTIKAVDLDIANEQRTLATVVAADSPCFGAAAMVDGPLVCPPRKNGPVYPGPAAAQIDRTTLYDDNCFEPAPFTGTRTCSYGDPNAAVSIALVGNSHAGQWFTTIEPLMAIYDFKITTFVSDACNLSSLRPEWNPPSVGAGCLAWGQRVMAATTTGHFNLVVTSEIQTHWPLAAHSIPAEESRLSQLGYADEINRWTAAKVGVLVIRNTPNAPTALPSIPTCVATHPSNVTPCSGARADWLNFDILSDTAKTLAGPNVTIADLSDDFCDATRCYGVIGGVIVFYDNNHMTKTFARTLTPYFAPFLATAIDHATANQ